MHLFMAPEPSSDVKFVPDRKVTHEIFHNSRLEDAPYIEAQQDLELMFDKCQLKKRIRAELDVPEFKDYLDSLEGLEDLSYEFCLDLCVQMCIHKRALPSSLIGILYHHFDKGQGRQAAMQQCANSLEQAAHANLIDYSQAREEFIVRLQMPAEVERELDLYQYPLPMMVHPDVIRTNQENGYLTKECNRSLVVLRAGKSSSFYATEDVCLDHLNRVNSISLTLNMTVANLIDNEWSNLDRRKQGETQAAYEQRLKAFEKYDSSSKDVMHALMGLRDRFWLTHKYDRRGRVYCQGYHVTYQGNSWNKAVIEFANKELIDK